MDTVNEKTTWTVTCTFTDEAGDPVTPSTGTYRLDDKYTGTEIKDDTVISPSSSTHDIVITADENAMVTATRASEIHRLTLTFIYGGKTGRDEYFFIVNNMEEIT